MRCALAVTLAILVASAQGASAQGVTASPLPDAPRWRLRVAALTGIGGARDQGDTITVFPTTMELGVRVWGPLSLDATAAAIQAGRYYVACGEPRRPSAVVGAGGLRLDLANGRAASWIDPFVEGHLGVGGQGGPPESRGVCEAGSAFVTGGGRAGIDVWLGRVAVSVVAGYDYLPTAAPLSLSVGATFILY